MKDPFDAYSEKVQELLSALRSEKDAVHTAAELIADAWQAGRGIYIFGCTHSAILAEDVFYRAGAPAFWRPLWGPGMSIAVTPGFLTSAMEKNEEVGRSVIQCSQISKGDVLVVVSTSGKNAAPVAVAEEALKRGVRLILITSSAYREQKGNHSRIPNLWAFRDQAVMLDNHVPCGDAMITEPGCHDHGAGMPHGSRLDHRRILPDARAVGGIRAPDHGPGADAARIPQLQRARRTGAQSETSGTAARPRGVPPSVTDRTR